MWRKATIQQVSTIKTVKISIGHFWKSLWFPYWPEIIHRSSILFFLQLKLTYPPTSLLTPTSLGGCVLSLLSMVSCSTAICSSSLLEEKDEKTALCFGSIDVSSARAWMTFSDNHTHEVIWPWIVFFIRYIS